jgi:mannose/fructose-specific phosphotransferase system component IIA
MASSALREESEEIYSGVSSVPMISSESKSRLKENKEEVKHEITQESRKQVKGKLTLEWCVSLGHCPPWVACLYPWLWGFL